MKTRGKAKKRRKQSFLATVVLTVVLSVTLSLMSCSPAGQNGSADAKAEAASPEAVSAEVDSEKAASPEAAFEKAASEEAASPEADSPEAASAEVDSVEAVSEKGASAEAGSEGAASETEDPDKTPDRALSDGSHVPTMFTVSGGTGKVRITCPEVVLTEGAAQARIEFSSPHYEWVKADGVQYDPVNAEDADRENSVFNLPVRLDEEMVISGLTTAMSEPHEVEYTIFISLTRKDPAAGKAGTEEEAEAENPAGGSALSESSGPPALEGLTFVSAMETSYAETFDIFTYQSAEGGGEDLYRLIDVHDSGRYLVLPENGGADRSAAQQKILKALPASVTVLQAPLDNIYVAATSSMALFDGAGAIRQVKLTGTKEEGWYIDAPKKALADGSMVYAGKYSAPDYELLASSGCDLAVESMMILHTPEVMEKLEELGIPVFIDTSSNESHPLGRTEWVRLYGVLTGHEKEAEAFFEKQAEKFAETESYTDTGLTVSFFSISANGNVIVRASDDYIPRMIELAGGTYAFRDLRSGSGSSASVRLSMEDFYKNAKDADCLIYNATIENPVRSLSELCGKSALLADFRAVQNGNVWQVERSLYQSPDIAAQMITDLHRMLTGENASGMVFLKQLN